VTGGKRLRLCLILGLVWLVALYGSLLMPGTAIGGALGGIMVLAAILIVVVHSSLLYGWAGTATYLVIGSIVGFALEASSIATGFPFGSYVHNTGGPKPLGVPIHTIFSYVILGWFAWIVGRAMVLDRPERIAGSRLFAAPLIAALVLAGLDFPFDPLGHTIRNDWTFTYPGGLFGVPLTNALGWIFTGWVLFQIMALVDRRFAATQAAAQRSYWLLPCVMWIAFASQLLFGWSRAPEGTVSLGESTFVISDIHEAAVMAAIFSMLLPALIAVFRLLENRTGETGQ